MISFRNIFVVGDVFSQKKPCELTKITLKKALKNWKFQKQLFPGSRCSYSTKVKGKKVFFLTKILSLNKV